MEASNNSRNFIPSLVGATALVALLQIPLSSGQAQTHGAHAHGAGALNLAMDGNIIEIGIELPGSDTVGFEHKPSTDEQKRAVTNAVKALQDGGALFQFSPDAQCTFITVEIESDLIDETEHAEESVHSEHSGEHEEHHADFDVHYQFQCAHPENATYVDIALFKSFPSLIEIEANTLTDNGQGAKELTPEDSRLTF